MSELTTHTLLKSRRWPGRSQMPASTVACGNEFIMHYIHTTYKGKRHLGSLTDTLSNSKYLIPSAVNSPAVL